MRRPASAALLAALAAREPTELRVAVVAAHPDDETIGAGASLGLLRTPVLVHVTDGAPRSGHDARAAGHASPAAYAAARRAELGAALKAGGVRAELVELGVPDQGATAVMADTARRLANVFAARRVEAAVPAVTVTANYRVVYGGVAATVPGNSIRQILETPGVVAVQRDELNQPLTDSSPAFINALLGNLDTGVWPEHPAFADQGNLPA